MHSPSPLFDVIFALWPSAAEMANDMRVGTRCARYWIARGRIPMVYWPLLINLCAEKFGRIVTYESLMAATVARKGAGVRRVAALGLYRKGRRKEEGRAKEAA